MKKTFRISDMHCSACVMRLESLEDELDGIHGIRASYHKQILWVDFDESRCSPEMILQAVEAKGYHAEPVD